MPLQRQKKTSVFCKDYFNELHSIYEQLKCKLWGKNKREQEEQDERNKQGKGGSNKRTMTSHHIAVSNKQSIQTSLDI